MNLGRSQNGRRRSILFICTRNRQFENKINLTIIERLKEEDETIEYTVAVEENTICLYRKAEKIIWLCISQQLYFI